MSRHSQWLFKWLIPAGISALIGLVLVSTLHWAASKTDEVARERQQDLISLIVSQLQAKIAHDQESATVWDDAVVKVAEGDVSWLQANLGEWMNTYFGHDAAIVLTSNDEPVYEFIVPSKSTSLHADLRTSYMPLVERLRARLRAGDREGISGRVLSIGESDLKIVGSRPAVVSVKPIVSDTGEITQPAGKESLHVAVRFLDTDFQRSIAAEYQFANIRFTPEDHVKAGQSHIVLKSDTGEVVGYLRWNQFTPGLNVLNATLPTIGLAVVAIFLTTCAAGHLLCRRSVRLASSRAQLQHLAMHDTLTGLANRGYFEREVAARLRGAFSSKDCGVLFLDLDRFKAVNDTYGHPTGDKLIRIAAERMRNLLPDALVGRIGGDEFTVLLEGRDRNAIESIAKELVGCMREPFDIEGLNISIGASVGAAVGNAQMDAIELTRQADIALYHAKSAGRNTYAVFGAHMDELLRTRRKLEVDLRAAVETPIQIETVYQPVFSADGGTVRSIEALSRWRHPQMGLVAPDVFIPLAEEIGVIHQIGAIVLENACRLGASCKAVGVAINASAVELDSSGYCLRVLTMLSKWGVAPARLEIEITETAAIKGEEQTDRNIAMLRAAGVRFAIDDFGTGHSSFARIQKMAVDRIKIDKSFVQAIHHDRSRALVEAMIAMARAQGLSTTAEGVETVDQLNALKVLGCDNVQGFLMSKPIPPDELISLLESGSVEESARFRT
uniref:putative bifunctional diguanylate cyclase/phosphodiesterase n=1 Tax=Ensifer adhaerens TaxID=106592 RepID=UPI003F495048